MKHTIHRKEGRAYSKNVSTNTQNRTVSCHLLPRPCIIRPENNTHVISFVFTINFIDFILARFRVTLLNKYIY